MSKKPTKTSKQSEIEAKTAKKKRNKKKKNGRPTKFKPIYCKKIVNYFANAELYETIKLEHYNEDGSIKWIDEKRTAALLPTLVNFAKSIKVSYWTLYNWQNPKHTSYHKSFLQAYTHAKALQKNFLIQAGLLGLYNPAFAKFTAMNITDMRESKELNIGGQKDNPLMAVPVILTDETGNKKKRSAALPVNPKAE
jgi:hypothetical protein